MVANHKVRGIHATIPRTEIHHSNNPKKAPL
jgi:hypothetical protein